MTVLETGVADVAFSDAGMPGKLPGDPGCVRADLFDPQPIVLAVTAELDVEDFIDLELWGAGTNARSEQRRAQRGSPVRYRGQKSTQKAASSAGTTW